MYVISINDQPSVTALSHWRYAMLVRDVLGTGPSRVIEIHADAFVTEALEKMHDERVGSLVVLDKGNLIGIVTERDYARKIVLKAMSAETTKISEIMTRDVLTVDVEQSIDSCLALMTENRIRHLPVVEGDAVVGVLSIRDLTAAVVDNMTSELARIDR